MNFHAGRKLAPVMVAAALALTVGLEARAAGAKDTVNHIIATFASTQDTGAIANQLSGLIDFQKIAQLAFAPAQWKQFSAQDQKQIVTTFRELIEKRYYPRWHKLFSKSKVEVADEATSAGSHFVRTYVNHGKEKDSVIWRLQDDNGNLAVVDLNVNGKGLDARLGERVQTRLTKEGARKFVSWLKEQARSETADNGSKSNM
ncbi:MAG TPA: ABC transporter substrate-binding protein [Candidatus Obscuribacterales bacterium]